MTVKCTVLIEQGEKSYGAHVPDLPGCVAVGKTVAEVERLIREAIELHLEAMVRDNDLVTEPTTQCRLIEVDLDRITAQVAQERASG
jgi:predicted RNase H-like HicB family nuclease